MKKVSKGLRKGFTLIELIFVLVIAGLAIAYISQQGTNSMTESEVDNTIAKSTQTILMSLPKYKFDYYESEKKYSKLNAETLKPFANTLELVGAGTDSYLHPLGYTSVKYYVGADGSAGVDNTKAWLCVDFRDMAWDDDFKTIGEQKFASMVTKFQPNAHIDGATSVMTGGTAATFDADGKVNNNIPPNSDGLICANNLE